VRVPVRRLDLDDAFADLEDRHIERSASEIEDGDRLVLLLVEPVGEGGGGRLVDDPFDLEPRDLARVLGGLALGIVEVGGNRDDGGSTFSPRCCSAASRSFWRTIAEISGGEKSFPRISTAASPFAAATTLYGTIFISSETSPCFRPMNLLIE
jgi:hypothetical protein